MSEFDKEAEREKLREKFARDEEKRKSTQRMSELLLKGATMTNRHCDTCGDPIFRYQGQEFCPTCQNAQVADSAEAAQSADRTDEAQTEQKARSDADGSDEVEVTPEPPQSGESSTARPTAGDGPADGATTQRSTPTPTASVSATPTNSPSASTSGDLSEARAALVRTVTRYATAAESADDPRRAKELLSAAREAAETLSALNR